MSFQNQLFDANKTIFAAFPGAYIMNATTDPSLNWKLFPVYKNVSDYSTIGITSQDNAYYVLPKYKVIVYNAVGYTGTSITIDNSGTAMYMYFTGVNDTGKSCKLYYNNVELS